MTDILSDLRDVTVLLKGLYHSRLSKNNITTLLTKRSNIQRKLLSLPSADDVRDHSQKDDYVFQSCRLAALI